MECRSAKRRKLSSNEHPSPLDAARHYCLSYADPPGFEVRPINKHIGDGVFTTKNFKTGDFLLTYKGDLIKNWKRARRLEIEYEEASLGSFIYFFKYRERKMCVDATDDIFHQGRMINDAEKGDPQQNCVMKIVEVDNCPHLCTFASRDISVGEELRYDYGVPTLPWRKKPKKNLHDQTTPASDKVLTKGNNYSEPAHINVDKNVPPKDEGQVNSEPGYTMSDQNVHTSNEELQDGRQHPEPEQIGSSLQDSTNRIITVNDTEERYSGKANEKVEICVPLNASAISCCSDQNQMLSSPVSSEHSEVDDSDKDSDYVPAKKIDASSDGSEIIQEIPDIRIFQKTLPKKSVSEFGATSENQYNSQDKSCVSINSEESRPGHEDNESESEVSVPRTNNGDYRHYDKRFYCLFCQCSFAKLQRHLAAKHRDEEDVLKFLNEDNKKVKQLLFEKMRNVGNHLHNSKVLKCGTGELAVAYRSRENQQLTADDYGPCPYCYAYYPVKDLWRHNKRCKFAPETSKRRRHAICSRLLLPQKKEKSNILTKILAGMKLDEVSRVAKSDPTILAYGEKLSSKQGHDVDQHNYIRQKLREAARLLQEMRTSGGSYNMSLENFIYPDKFKFIVKCCRIVAGFDNATNTYSTPSLALKIGGTLQKCLKILITKAIENSNKDLQSRAEALSTLFDYNWTDEVSSNALRTLGEGKRNSTKGLLPLANDVRLMSEYLQREADACSDRLKKQDDIEKAKQDWVYLSEICLTQTVLFNRRRAGEVSKMKIEDFRKKSLTNTDCEIDGKLTKFENALCRSLYRTEIIAKRGRTAPVIFTPQLNNNIELLLKKRHLISNPENLYLFPTRSTNAHIRGTDCIRKFAGICGAEQPDRLRSTKLRKHIATMTQLINLKENELDILANFLGHDIRVHREFYRLPQATVQLAKVSKLLLLMEGGKVTQPTSPDDIDVEEEISSEQGIEDDSLSESSGNDVSEKPAKESLLNAPVRSMTNAPSKTTRSGSAKSFPKTKKYWSTQERYAVLKHFERHLAMGRLPGKDEIEKCLAEEADLSHRNWRNIKDFCRNTIVTTRRKNKL